MLVTVNNSPIQVYCSTYYEMTPGFKPFTVLYYTNCHTFVVHIIPKRWMPWTSKFLHFSYRIIHVVLSKNEVTILVSTDFAWWLPLKGLSWLPYAFSCAACLVAPSSSGTIPDTHLLLVGWKIILYKCLFFTHYPGYLKNGGYYMAAHSSGVEKYFMSEHNL